MDPQNQQARNIQNATSINNFIPSDNLKNKIIKKYTMPFQFNKSCLFITFLCFFDGFVTGADLPFTCPYSPTGPLCTPAIKGVIFALLVFLDRLILILFAIKMLIKSIKNIYEKKITKKILIYSLSFLLFLFCINRIGFQIGKVITSLNYSSIKNYNNDYK